MNRTIIRNGKYQKRGNEIIRLSETTTTDDPVAIITAGTALISTLFPNLFGGGRVRLTDADWVKLFPGNGYWTVQLRNYLSKGIHWNVDLNNIAAFTRYFVDENAGQICPEFGVAGGSPPAWPNQQTRNDCIQKFFELMRQESFTGGKEPFGQYPGGWAGGTVDWKSVIPIVAVGAVMLIALKGKKRGRK